MCDLQQLVYPTTGVTLYLLYKASRLESAPTGEQLIVLQPSIWNARTWEHTPQTLWAILGLLDLLGASPYPGL